jgi:hypothetical protein
MNFSQKRALGPFSDKQVWPLIKVPGPEFMTLRHERWDGWRSAGIIATHEPPTPPTGAKLRTVVFALCPCVLPSEETPSSRKARPTISTISAEILGQASGQSYHANHIQPIGAELA